MIPFFLNLLNKTLKYIKNNPVRSTAFFVSVAVFVVSCVLLVETQLAYRRGIKTYNSITEQVVTSVTNKDSVDQGDILELYEPNINTPPISVDFEKLKKVNQDIVGWIYCEDTPINYPIVKTDSVEDCDIYLKTSVDGKKSVSGSIFIDYRNSSDFSDLNTIIYGHSMKNGTMFAYLLRFDDQAFYEEHKYMWLFTEKAAYRIELISGNEVDATSEDYIIYNQSHELSDYLKRTVEKSKFASNTDLSSVKQIISLSTCAYSDKDSRFVVRGNLVKIEE